MGDRGAQAPWTCRCELDQHVGPAASHYSWCRMNRDEVLQLRAYVKANPMEWPALSPSQRLRLASLLRPDLPVGISPNVHTVPGGSGNRTQGAT